jgi:hypothetical protein
MVDYKVLDLEFKGPNPLEDGITVTFKVWYHTY